MSFLRYSKYKDSGIEWLGQVPEHWNILPVRSLAREQWEPNDQLQENNLLSLSYGRIVRKDINSNEGLLPESFDTYQIVSPGNLILRLTDMQNDQRSLRTGLVTERGIITSAYLALAPVESIDSRYFAYLFRAYDLTKVFYAMGGGLRQAMKFDDLKTMPILQPPYLEQTAIATFIQNETAKIDALVAEQETLITLLKEKRQAVISHAVAKGLNSAAPMKDSGIEWLGQIPAHWNVMRIRSVSSFVTSGPRGWSDRVGETGAVFVQSGDLSDNLRVEFATAKRVQVERNAETERTRLHNGDIVVCITGAKTGNVAVCPSVPEEAYINQHVCLVRPTRDIHPEFLAAQLKSTVGQTHFDLSQYGLKQGLSLENVKEAPVLLPPIDEQKEIIRCLSAQLHEVDTLAHEANKATQLLQERRSALISAAVTGQIDVRTSTERQNA